MLRKKYRIHLIGIGGSGMSGIAEILLQLKFKVTGSDIKESEITKRLADLGTTIFIGHKKENIGEVDAIVFSSAIKDDNPEIIEARNRKIPLLHRAEMLFELMRMKRGIAVAGTHGKTTTTSILGLILTEAGYDPTVIVGGLVHSSGTNARLGRGEYIVVEADESDGSFMRLTPEIAVVTNIDNDHLDFYTDFKNIVTVFKDFINRIPFYGFSVVCYDDPHIREILPQINRRVITYGIDSDEADVKAFDIEEDSNGSNFKIRYKNKVVGKFRINVPGRQYLLNSLAAASVGLLLGIKDRVIEKSIKEYSGVKRRFQLAGDINGVKIIDDYGHHPTEIKFTAQSAKKLNPRRLIAVFQPHRFSRTYYLYKEFTEVLEDNFDLTMLMDIYPADETNIYSVSPFWIYREFKNKDKIILVKDFEEVCSRIKEIVKEGDIVLCLGAGSIAQLVPLIADTLRMSNCKLKIGNWGLQNE
ncbi:MAG: UDP-N-acetylmuramate--L-alanine ligase [Candidatus Hydrogenedentota bacterium]